MEQALQNLAANALRYAPPGTMVELHAARRKNAVTIAISDEGPGIAPEHLPRVFDRFYKVDESRVAQGGGAGGSGLGLSIVKAIVERHGASITVNSRPGRTIFEIAGLPAGGR
jgi:signal transduction histidine kinase